MRISTGIQEDPTIRRSVNVYDGLVLDAQYRDGKTFQVSSVSVVYRQHRETGRWEPDRSIGITLGGYVLKKDDTPSMRWHRQSIGGNQFLPPWIDKIVGLLRPVGSVNSLKIDDLEVSE